MSALFNFESFLFVLLLSICTCTYIRSMWQQIIDSYKQGFTGTQAPMATPSKGRSARASSSSYTHVDRLMTTIKQAMPSCYGR